MTRLMVSAKYFIFFATIALITDIVLFFLISVATTVKKTVSFNISPIPQCLGLPNLKGQ